MERLVSTARPTSSRARCAFCHDTLGDEWDVCSGCNTRLHPECRAQAIDCPTLGCRMSVLRLRWAAPGLRARPAFRRALARMAERHASSRLQPEESPEIAPRRPALLRVAVLSGHALLSPFVLVAFVTYFIALYVPAYWGSVLVGAPDLAGSARESVRRPGHLFSFEAAFAPFLAIAFVALPAAVCSAGPGAAAIALAEVILGSIVMIPAALSWFDSV